MLPATPTPPTTRVLAIDGPGGSGKTTLAGAVADLAGGRVVHMDDLYDGWSGLERVDAQLDCLLAPMAAGGAGRYRRFDWHANAFAETVVVEPVDLLVVEGVGSGALDTADLLTALVWVEVPPDLALRRGVERDGEQLREQWNDWQRQEARHFARQHTRERADLLVDGAGLAAPVHLR